MQWPRRSLSRLHPQLCDVFSQLDPKKPAFSPIQGGPTAVDFITVKISLFIYSKCTSYLSGDVAQQHFRRNLNFGEENTLVVLRDIELFIFACACFSLTYLKDAKINVCQEELTEDILSPFRNLTPKEQFCMFPLTHSKKSNSFDSQESDP